MASIHQSNPTQSQNPASLPPFVPPFKSSNYFKSHPNQDPQKTGKRFNIADQKFTQLTNRLPSDCQNPKNQAVHKFLTETRTLAKNPNSLNFEHLDLFLNAIPKQNHYAVLQQGLRILERENKGQKFSVPSYFQNKLKGLQPSPFQLEKELDSAKFNIPLWKIVLTGGLFTAAIGALVIPRCIQIPSHPLPKINPPQEQFSKPNFVSHNPFKTDKPLVAPNPFNSLFSDSSLPPELTTTQFNEERYELSTETPPQSSNEATEPFNSPSSDSSLPPERTTTQFNEERYELSTKTPPQSSNEATKHLKDVPLKRIIGHHIQTCLVRPLSEKIEAGLQWMSATSQQIQERISNTLPTSLPNPTEWMGSQLSFLSDHAAQYYKKSGIENATEFLGDFYKNSTRQFVVITKKWIENAVHFRNAQAKQLSVQAGELLAIAHPIFQSTQSQISSGLVSIGQSARNLGRSAVSNLDFLIKDVQAHPIFQSTQSQISSGLVSVDQSARDLGRSAASNLDSLMKRVQANGKTFCIYATFCTLGVAALALRVFSYMSYRKSISTESSSPSQIVAASEGIIYPSNSINQPSSVSNPSPLSSSDTPTSLPSSVSASVPSQSTSSQLSLTASSSSSRSDEYILYTSPSSLSAQAPSNSNSSQPPRTAPSRASSTYHNVYDTVPSSSSLSNSSTIQPSSSSSLSAPAPSNSFSDLVEKSTRQLKRIAREYMAWAGNSHPDFWNAMYLYVESNLFISIFPDFDMEKWDLNNGKFTPLKKHEKSTWTVEQGPTFIQPVPFDPKRKSFSFNFFTEQQRRNILDQDNDFVISLQPEEYHALSNSGLPVSKTTYSS